MVSTLYAADGLFDIMEKEPEVLLLSWNIFSHITTNHRERTGVVAVI
ncbi:hypothetical protein BH18THE2_BH18THE2_36680 [soil metagenome]